MKAAHGDCCESGWILSVKILVNYKSVNLMKMELSSRFQNEDGAVKQFSVFIKSRRTTRTLSLLLEKKSSGPKNYPWIS